VSFSLRFCLKVMVGDANVENCGLTNCVSNSEELYTARGRDEKKK
jgi:hypothetical protein